MSSIARWYSSRRPGLTRARMIVPYITGTSASVVARPWWAVPQIIALGATGCGTPERVPGYSAGGVLPVPAAAAAASGFSFFSRRRDFGTRFILILLSGG